MTDQSKPDQGERSLEAGRVAQAAELARLELSPEAAARLPQEFERILGWFEKMEQLDVSGVEPLIGSPLVHEDVVREDSLREPFPAEKLLSNAPERGGESGEFYAVPRTLKGPSN